MYEPRSASRSNMRQDIRFAHRLPGRALRGAASPARACGPPMAFDRPRRKTHRSARFRALREAHTAANGSGASIPDCRGAQNESPAVSRRASCLWLWIWLRLGLAALQEQREAGKGESLANTPAHSVVAGGCVAGVRAPRHARDLRRGRSKHRRGPLRGPAKPHRARTPARAFRPTAACGFANLGRGLCRRSLCGPDSFRRAGVLAGGAAHAAAPRSRPPASEPLDVPTARAAKHAAPRAPARLARRTRQRTTPE